MQRECFDLKYQRGAVVLEEKDLKGAHSPRTLGASVSRSNLEPSVCLRFKTQIFDYTAKSYCPCSHLPAVFEVKLVHNHEIIPQ